MVDIAGFWVEAQSWFVPAIAKLRAQPVFLAFLIVPLVASLLSRSLTAILISALAVAIGLLTTRGPLRFQRFAVTIGPARSARETQAVPSVPSRFT
jgi:hypothetical protein